MGRRRSVLLILTALRVIRRFSSKIISDIFDAFESPCMPTPSCSSSASSYTPIVSFTMTTTTTAWCPPVWYYIYIYILFSPVIIENRRLLCYACAAYNIPIRSGVSHAAASSRTESARSFFERRRTIVSFPWAFMFERAGKHAKRLPGSENSRFSSTEETFRKRFRQYA